MSTCSSTCNRGIVNIQNVRTLSVNIKFMCTSFRNRKKGVPLTIFSFLFRDEYKYIFKYFPSMCMAVAQWRQMRQMPHFWNGKCNLLKANQIFFFLQNLSKFTPFASLYSDPAYGRDVRILCFYYNVFAHKKAKTLAIMKFDLISYWVSTTRSVFDQIPVLCLTSVYCAALYIIRGVPCDLGSKCTDCRSCHLDFFFH